MDFESSNNANEESKIFSKSVNKSTSTTANPIHNKRTKSVALSSNQSTLFPYQHSNLGLFEFRTLLTGQADEISKHMIESTRAFNRQPMTQQEQKDSNALSFNQFRTFLDLNSYLRSMFLEALNPLMWAIDPTGKPLPKHLHDKGTILEIAVETQKQFLYLLKARDYEEALQEFSDPSAQGGPITKQKEAILKGQNGSSDENLHFIRKCS